MNEVNWYVVSVTSILCLYNLAFMQWNRTKNKKGFIEKIKSILPETKNKKLFFLFMTCSCLFLGVYISANNSGLTTLYIIKRICLIAVLFPMAAVDFRTCRIPNQLLIVAAGCRLCILIFEISLQHENLIQVVISEFVSAILLLIACVVILRIVKKSIGMGDVKLFLVMALFQGFSGVISAIIASLYVAFVISILLLVTGRKNRKDTIAFGPSILIGTFMSVVLTGS